MHVEGLNPIFLSWRLNDELPFQDKDNHILSAVYSVSARLAVGLDADFGWLCVAHKIW